jgi:hypothetical protein
MSLSVAPPRRNTSSSMKKLPLVPTPCDRIQCAASAMISGLRHARMPAVPAIILMAAVAMPVLPAPHACTARKHGRPHRRESIDETVIVPWPQRVDGDLALELVRHAEH